MVIHTVILQVRNVYLLVLLIITKILEQLLKCASKPVKMVYMLMIQLNLVYLNAHNWIKHTEIMKLINAFRYVLKDNLLKMIHECALIFALIIATLIVMLEYVLKFVRQHLIYMEIRQLNNASKHVHLLLIYMLKIQQECVVHIVHFLNRHSLISWLEDV